MESEEPNASVLQVPDDGRSIQSNKMHANDDIAVLHMNTFFHDEALIETIYCKQLDRLKIIMCKEHISITTA